MSKQRSIEEKRHRLGELLAWFESDLFRLDEALTKFEEARTLAADIERDLTKLQNTIQEVKQRFDKGEA